MNGFDVEAVLRDHGAIGYDDCDGCECGADVRSHDAHRAHVAAVLRVEIESALGDAWDARDVARAQYLGPNDGHYDGCMGWEDCHCATYPNPYRASLAATEGDRQ